MEQTIQQLANIQRNWGPKMNSPGVSIKLKENSREKLNGQTSVTYRLFASGFPKNLSFTIFTTGFDLRPVPAVQGVTLDDSGDAVCSGKPGMCSGDKPGDPIDIKLVAAKGQPVRLALISSDGQLKAFTGIILFPITGSDRGCSIEAIRLTQNAEAVLLEGTGFAPSSDAHIRSSSEGESQETVVKADENGGIEQIQLPYVSGKANGITTVNVTSRKCNPSLSYNWGKDSYQIQ
jgi:hypothetical protein